MSGSNSTRRGSHFKRRRRRGSYLGVTGKYPTTQNKHSLFYESLRERDLFVLLAYQDDVVGVEDHPFSIEIKVEGRKRRYTPDAKVKYVHGQDDVIEVKTKGELQRKQADYDQIFGQVEKHFEAEGRQFQVVTEERLPRPMVRSLRFLFPYRLYPRDATIEAQILAEVVSPCRLRGVCEALAKEGVEEGDTIAQVWRLVALRKVSVDFDHSLSMNSMLEGRAWSTKL